MSAHTLLLRRSVGSGRLPFPTVGRSGFVCQLAMNSEFTLAFLFFACPVVSSCEIKCAVGFCGSSFTARSSGTTDSVNFF